MHNPKTSRQFPSKMALIGCRFPVPKSFQYLLTNHKRRFLFSLINVRVDLPIKNFARNNLNSSNKINQIPFLHNPY